MADSSLSFCLHSDLVNDMKLGVGHTLGVVGVDSGALVRHKVVVLPCKPTELHAQGNSLKLREFPLVVR
jgi:hypothetical protein